MASLREFAAQGEARGGLEGVVAELAVRTMFELRRVLDDGRSGSGELTRCNRIHFTFAICTTCSICTTYITNSPTKPQPHHLQAANTTHHAIPPPRLPPELRTQIWELVLVVPSPLIIRQTSQAPRTILRQPPLTRINRQTRSETLPIFYSQNSFLIEDPKLGDKSEVLQCWFRVNSNEVAQKYTKKVVYRFQRYTGLNRNTELSAVHMTLNETGKLDFAIQGSVSEACVCSLVADLQKLAAEMPVAATPEDRAAVMGGGLIALQGSIVPGLRGVLEKRERAIQRYGARRALSVTKPCADCGKMRWAGLWEGEMDEIRRLHRAPSRCGMVDYRGLFRGY
ncbi:hypothetical protein LTR17_006953 [Elasticomyces elasticus]|nr:hypothetical protein LTR17_006953 [Elasticomyces elasticus]